MARVIDAILVLVLVEAAALTLYHRRTRTGIAPGKLLPNLAAGFFLMLALRLALGDAPRWAVPACLLAGLFAHLADVAGRWERHRRGIGLSDM